MIFYFSGTGNSAWVAKELGRLLDQSVSSVSLLLQGMAQAGKAQPIVYTAQENEPVVFVFPVHSWGPAVLMRRFIEALDLRLPPRSGGVSFVATCGDDAAYTDRIIRKLLKKKGIALNGAYALQMPNNYLLLPGFGVDAPDVEHRKLEQAPKLVERIADGIRQGGVPETGLYAHTNLPGLKSYGVYPLFCRFKIGKTSFWTTDACVGCGLCVKLCPTGNIRMENQRPQWSDRCVECVACIHRCPQRAIEYGKSSVGQGRYVHPDLKQYH